MQLTRNVYYFDYAPETYNYLMTSRILRQSEKDLLKGIVEGKTVKELALDNRCCEMTICRKRKILYEKTKDYI